MSRRAPSSRFAVLWKSRSSVTGCRCGSVPTPWQTSVSVFAFVRECLRVYVRLCKCACDLTRVRVYFRENVLACVRACERACVRVCAGVRTYVCVRARMRACIRAREIVCVCMFDSLRAYVRPMCVCGHTSTLVCASLRVRVCVCACVRACVCACMHEFVHVCKCACKCVC